MGNVAATDQGTIHIQWLRSGIGFPSRQKEMVRSLGLRRLNEVVERPDTPQIRGLVAAIPHLVRIVAPRAAPAWASVAEYDILPPEVAPAEARRTRSRPEKEQAAPEAAAAEKAAPAEKAKAAEEEKKAAVAPAAKGAKTRKAAAHKEKPAKAPEGKKAKAASKAKAPKKSKK
jgi:large subunit ribosomal protein L30